MTTTIKTFHYYCTCSFICIELKYVVIFIFLSGIAGHSHVRYVQVDNIILTSLSPSLTQCFENLTVDFSDSALSYRISKPQKYWLLFTKLCYKTLKHEIEAVFDSAAKTPDWANSFPVLRGIFSILVTFEEITPRRLAQFSSIIVCVRC